MNYNGSIPNSLTGTWYFLKMTLPFQRASSLYPIIAYIALTSDGGRPRAPFATSHGQHPSLPFHTYIPANGLSNQGGVLLFLAPSLKFRIALGRANLHVFVASKGMDRGSSTEGQCTSHNNHDGIGRGIRKPAFSEGVGILFEGLVFGSGLDVDAEEYDERIENRCQDEFLR